MKKKIYLAFIILVVCVAPFANDLFTAGLIGIAKEFETSQGRLMFTTFLFGLATSQLCYGPLLDRYGRKPVILAGLCLVVLTNILIINADSFALLLWGRFFEGVGSCSVIVTVMSIMRDMYPPESMVKMMSVVMTVLGIAPVLAPFIGGLVVNQWGWRSAFYFVAGFTAIFIVFYLFFFKETLKQKNLSALNTGHIIHHYKTLLCNKNFTRFCLSSACSYGMLFAFLSSAPLLIMHLLGYNSIHFGIIVAIDTMAIITMSHFTPQFVKKFSLDKVIMAGLSLIILGGILLFVLVPTWGYNLYTLMIPVFISTLGVGLVRPATSAGAMKLANHKAVGSAAACFNFIAFLGGAFSTLIANSFIHDYLSLAIVFVVFSLIGIIINIRRNKV